MKYLLILFFTLNCSDSFKYKVINNSMSNTLNYGQEIIISQNLEIEYNDIIAFKEDYYSKPNLEIWILRVVAMSGDSIRIEKGEVIVNNNMIKLPENARLLYHIKTNMPINPSFLLHDMLVQLGENDYNAYLTTE